MRKLFVATLMSCAFMGAAASYADSGSFGYRERARSPIGLPEPTTLALLAAGAAGLGVFGLIRRRNRK